MSSAALPAMDSLFSASLTRWLAVAATTILTIAGARCAYLLRWHPASKYPGPKLAALSDVYYVYQLLTGRWPWKAEELHKKYGPVFRIGPNQLVFSSPQAGKDIYEPAVRHHETWRKIPTMDFGTGDLGFVWETDPAKRRQVAKKVLPAFSAKATRAKEPVVHDYIDQFVAKMKRHGSQSQGIDLARWMLWLSLDMSGDLAYGREMFHMRDERDSEFMITFTSTLLYATIIQASRMIPMLKLVSFFFMPIKVMKVAPKFFSINRQEVEARINKRGNTKHPDFVDFMLPLDAPPPQTKKEKTHFEQVALQLFIAGYDPIRLSLYGNIFFLLKNPQCYASITNEIRSRFETYDSITTEALAELPYLNACLHETLRIWTLTSSGMARKSPGATVDGIYVPEGMVCQVSLFTIGRSEKHFREPLEYHPERWLNPNHPEYDQRFSSDDLKSHFPFGMGPRACTGREIAWQQLRLFLAKVLWTFDVSLVEGQDVDLNKHFRSYVTWEYPSLWVRFVER